MKKVKRMTEKRRNKQARWQEKREVTVIIRSERKKKCILEDQSTHVRHNTMDQQPNNVMEAYQIKKDIN